MSSWEKSILDSSAPLFRSAITMRHAKNQWRFTKSNSFEDFSSIFRVILTICFSEAFYNLEPIHSFILIYEQLIPKMQPHYNQMSKCTFEAKIWLFCPLIFRSTHKNKIANLRVSVFCPFSTGKHFLSLSKSICLLLLVEKEKLVLRTPVKQQIGRKGFWWENKQVYGLLCSIFHKSRKAPNFLVSFDTFLGGSKQTSGQVHKWWPSHTTQLNSF